MSKSSHQQSSQNVIISGVILPLNKRLVIALQSVFGIGPYIAKQVCKNCGIPEGKKPFELTEPEILSIRSEVENILVGDDLKAKLASDRARLNSIGCRRAIRTQKGLPARGQKSKSNRKTSKRMRGFGQAIGGLLKSNLKNKNLKTKTKGKQPQKAKKK